MNKLLRCVLIVVVLPVITKGQADKNTYAITAVNNGSNDWVALRTLNVKTGKFGHVLVNMNDKGLPRLGKPVSNLASSINLPALALNTKPNSKPSPVNTGIAAMAYDHTTNRLFYVPMSNDNLQYIDLATMKVAEGEGPSFSKAGSYTFRSTSPISRLVIAPDGYGYTVTTDGSHLMRFTTNNKPVLTDLGELVDAPANKEMTVLNPCTNAGGDMVADDAGSLYLITASNRVYKINISSRVTTYQATITGLPPGFTTNGGAVNENGQLVVSSSMFKEGSFMVDHKTWKAFPSPVQQQMVGIADLASSNVLKIRKTVPAAVLLDRPFVKTGSVRLYPNPVLFDEVNIQFNDLPFGKYTIELADALGRKVVKQKVRITRETQTTLLQIPTITAQAFYYVRILNEKNILVSAHKLAVERD